MDDRQLRWVSANRARRTTERRVGPALARVLESLAVAGTERMEAFAGRIDTVVDDEFRRHCRICFLDAATLAIQVDSSSLVYAMRARWLPTVQRICSEVLTAPRIRRIVFAEGADGVRLKPKAGADGIADCESAAPPGAGRSCE